MDIMPTQRYTESLQSVEKQDKCIKKIKLVMIASYLQMDGIGSVIMNYCTHLDRNRFDITIIAGIPVSGGNKIKCVENDIHLKELPKRKSSPMKFFKELNMELSGESYDICHIHGNSATNTIELFIAWRNHIKVRIMHCHSSQCEFRKIHQILLPIFKRLYTKAFACSELAGNWIFGQNKFTVIPNAFETEQYRFDPIKREHYRKELSVGESFLIGFVGRINAPKNYWYVIRCFEEYWKENPQTKLLMVGTGEGIEEIEQYMKSSLCKNNIVLYGESGDISGILSAMDVFLFPSRYEGLGIAAIEAQINGLPCMISDRVPREVQLSDQCVFLPIGDENISLWIEKLRESSELAIDRAAFYVDHQKEIRRYDIRESVKFVEDLYLRYISAV